MSADLHALAAAGASGETLRAALDVLNQAHHDARVYDALKRASAPLFIADGRPSADLREKAAALRLTEWYFRAEE